MKFLLVEDDKVIMAGLRYSLETEGYQVICCGSIREGKKALYQEQFDLCLLDLSLPDGSGYELCRLIKLRNEATPVMFITASDEEVSVVMGLDMGADDYVTKPFRLRELLSRIRSVLRRCGRTGLQRSTLALGDILLNTLDARIYKNGKEIILTALEYRLLLTFAQNQGKILTRSQLLEGIWDSSGDFVNDNTLTVYIKRLREKLEDDPQNPKLIQTVRGLGYKAGEE